MPFKYTFRVSPECSHYSFLPLALLAIPLLRVVQWFMRCVLLGNTHSVYSRARVVLRKTVVNCTGLQTFVILRPSASSPSPSDVLGLPAAPTSRNLFPMGPTSCRSFLQQKVQRVPIYPCRHRHNLPLSQYLPPARCMRYDQ